MSAATCGDEFCQFTVSAATCCYELRHFTVSAATCRDELCHFTVSASNCAGIARACACTAAHRAQDRASTGRWEDRTGVPHQIHGGLAQCEHDRGPNGDWAQLRIVRKSACVRYATTSGDLPHDRRLGAGGRLNKHRPRFSQPLHAPPSRYARISCLRRGTP